MLLSKYRMQWSKNNSQAWRRPSSEAEGGGGLDSSWALTAGEEAGSTGVLEEEMAGFAENEDKFGPQGLIPFRDFYCKK